MYIRIGVGKACGRATEKVLLLLGASERSPLKLHGRKRLVVPAGWRERATCSTTPLPPILNNVLFVVST